MRRVLMCGLLLAVAATTWGANLDLPPGKWWEDARVAERVGLSQAQQGEIRDLVYEHARRMIDLNAAVKRSELELADLVDRDRLDVTKVRAAFTAFQDARRALEDERFEMMLAIRKVLTAEQWQGLQELRQEVQRRRALRGDDGPERRPRPRGGAGERPRLPPGR